VGIVEAVSSPNGKPNFTAQATAASKLNGLGSEIGGESTVRTGDESDLQSRAGKSGTETEGNNHGTVE
jgi:hypothetical protein